MGYNDADVYYQPEKFGLSIVGEINWDDESYQFDKTVVWKDEDGQLYWASDSGCSCPSPFEDFTDITSLQTGSFNDLDRYLTYRIRELAECDWRDQRDYYMPQVVDVLSRARLIGLMKRA